MLRLLEDCKNLFEGWPFANRYVHLGQDSENLTSKGMCWAALLTVIWLPILMYIKQLTLVSEAYGLPQSFCPIR